MATVPNPSEYYTSKYSGEEIDNAIGQIVEIGALTAANIPMSDDDPTTVATELEGKAPGGFGFGEPVAQVQAQSASESYETFCQKIDDLMADWPNQTAAIINAYPPQIYGRTTVSPAILYRGDQDYTTLYSLGWDENTAQGWRMLKYIPSGGSVGVWQPFEWVNPPLNLGVEYRTVERYQGKPVYAKLVNCGAFAAPGTVKTITFDNTGNLAYIVDFSGNIGNGGNNSWSIPTYLYGSHYDDDSIVLAECRTGADGTGLIYLYTKTRDLTAIQAYVLVKYTKTID